MCLKIYHKTHLAGSLIVILLSMLSARESLALVTAYASDKAFCDPVFSPDLATIETSAQIESEIETILEKYMDNFLGTSATTAADMEKALSSYNALNIVVTDGVISGNTVKNDYKAVNFLKKFVNHFTVSS